MKRGRILSFLLLLLIIAGGAGLWWKKGGHRHPSIQALQRLDQFPQTGDSRRLIQTSTMPTVLICLVNHFHRSPDTKTAFNATQLTAFPSFEWGKDMATVNQRTVFHHKVCAQLQPSEATLAKQLPGATQQIVGHTGWDGRTLR